MNHFGKLLAAVLIFQTTSYYSFTAFAQENTAKRKFYVGVDGGLGLLKLSRNGIASERNSCFSLGFNGGVIPFRWLRTGINLNGYLIESYGDFYDNPEKGISISNFYGQVQIFPFKKPDLFINISGGFSKYINMHPDESNAKGSGAIFGLGYAKSIFKRLEVSLTINYGFGSFKDVENVSATVRNQHYNITEFLIGFTYY